MKKGYIYCLTNISVPNKCKVGMITRHPETRCAELYTTSIPTPFDIEYYIEVDDAFIAEKCIHDNIVNKGYPRHTGREWFICNPNEIKSIFDNYHRCYPPVAPMSQPNNNCSLVRPILQLNNNCSSIKPILEPNNNNIQCKHCKMSFKSSNGLWRHVSSIHELIDEKMGKLKKNKIYTCISCDKKFTSKKYSVKHQKKCKKKT